MFKRLVVCFSMLALAVASAATHSVTLFQPSVINGTELKPGDYKLQIQDQKVVISKGKNTVEAPVKVETVDSKYASTSVRYENGQGKLRVQEIRIGGTNTKLVFN